MLRYAAQRLLVAMPMLAGLLALSFFYTRLLPGDPVTAMLGVEGNSELVSELRHRHGLDRPLTRQFIDWVGDLLHGDFGLSFRSQLPVTDLITSRVPAAAELAFVGLLATMLLAIPAGLYAGLHRGSRLDSLITTFSLVGLAVPGFWIGVLLVAVFAIRLGWLPSQGYVPFTEDPLENLRLLILPVATLALSSAPYLMRLTRSAVIEVVDSAFVPYGQSKGLAERTISTRYVLRNAMPNLVAAIGLSIGALLGGAVVIEQLFTWPGTGKLILDAVGQRDYTMIQAVICVYGATFVVVNLLAELVQGVLDPRIRLT